MRSLVLILMSLVIFPSCQTRPEISDLPQCSPVLVSELILAVDPISQETYQYDVINKEKSYCQCRPYRFSKKYIGPSGTVTVHPIEKCNKMVGWETPNYIKVARFWEAVRVMINASEN